MQVLYTADIDKCYPRNVVSKHIYIAHMYLYSCVHISVFKRIFFTFISVNLQEYENQSLFCSMSSLATFSFKHQLYKVNAYVLTSVP